MKKLKILLLKFALTKEERQFVCSALRSAEERYRERYNDINCESYKSIELAKNIPKLTNIIALFYQTL